jgi:hypothetical protein
MVQIINKKFGKLLVLEKDHKNERGRMFYKCKCDCGKIKVLSYDTIVNGHSTHCGCSRAIKHGLGKDKRLYNIYCLMKHRCEERTCNAYKDYGGRGISICAEWKDPIKFRDWAYSHGYNNKLTIERIDVNKGYSPENCCWISKEKQNLNKRNSVKYKFLGFELNISTWRKILKIPPTSFYRQIKTKDYKTIFMKYLWRAGLKEGNSNVQDLRKAVWYIQDEIKKLEGEIK